MKTDRLIKTILFATDFSACAERAYQHALYWANAWGAAMHVLHVVEFQPGMDPYYDVNRLYLQQIQKETYQHMASLAERANRLHVNLAMQEAIGLPSVEIKRVAREIQADLIVLGTRGRTGLAHVLLGSTAERVIKGATCPVLAVREAEVPGGETQDAEAPIAVDRVLVPIDFSDCSLDALEYAAHIARHFKAAVTIMHVMEPVAYGLDFTLSQAADPDRRERIRARLNVLTRALTGSGLTANDALRGWLPAESILSFAHTEGRNLIVMGTHGRRGLSHLVSGSVTEAVLRRARCPVLTVRSAQFSPGHRWVVPIGLEQTKGA